MPPASTTTSDRWDPTDVLDSGEAGGRAIRGSSLRALGYLAGALVTLISAPLLFRQLGVVDFGRYVTVVSLIANVAGITDEGLGAVAVREFAARPRGERDELLRSVLGARIVLSVAGILAAAAFSLVAGYGTDLVIGTLVAGAGLLANVVQGTYAVPMSAGLRLVWLTAADFGRSVATVVLVVVLVLVGSGVIAFLAVPVLPAAAVLVATAITVRRVVPLRPALHPRHWWALVRETLPLAAANVLGTLYFRMVIVMMPLVATGLETGYFATSYRITEVLGGIPLVLVTTTFPILSRAARNDAARLAFALQRIFEVAVIGGVWMSLVTALGAGFAIAVIGGHEAAPATDVLRIQAVALTAMFLSMSWQNALMSLRRHREMLVSSAVGLTVIVVMTLALVPPLGARGAAIGVVVAETALMATAAFFVRRSQEGLRLELGVVPRVALAAAVTVGLTLAIDLPDVVRGALATPIYFAALAAVRGIPREARDAFAAVVPWGRRGAAPASEA